MMRNRIVFITGTDTGVGKTVLATVLTSCLRNHGLRVAALKPICSGGREDARVLRRLLDGAMTLQEINPWNFRAPLAPLLAARRERKRVKAADVVAYVRKVRRNAEVVVVEGAGGLLSPLGEDFNARHLIVALRAVPLIVCPNRLGAVNQALLVMAALPARAAREAQVILMAQRQNNAASRANPDLLAEYLGVERVHLVPWLRASKTPDAALRNRPVRRAIEVVVQRIMHTSSTLVYPGPSIRAQSPTSAFESPRVSPR